MFRKSKMFCVGAALIVASFSASNAVAYTLDDVYQALMGLQQKIESFKSDILAYFAASQTKSVTAKAEEKFKKAPGVDATASGTVGVAAVGGQIKTIETAIDTQATIAKKELNDSNYLLYGENLPGQDPIADPSTYIQEQHFNSYCVPALANKDSGILSSSKLCQGSGNLPYVDINIATSLLDKQVLSPTDVPIAALAIRNFIAPMPRATLMDALKEDKTLQKMDNKKAVASLLSEAASSNAAFAALNEMLKTRIGVEVPKEGSQEKEVRSINQMMDVEATRRFQNADWYKKIDAATDTALLRELAHIMAYNNWLQYQQYKQNEMLQILLVTLHQDLVRAERNTSEAFSSIPKFDTSGGYSGSAQ
jgi:hypothetical protein